MLKGEITAVYADKLIHNRILQVTNTHDQYTCKLLDTVLTRLERESARSAVSQFGKGLQENITRKEAVIKKNNCRHQAIG